MLEILQYGFMQKAFITGIVIAIACSLLGTFLVLRKYALIGDGLAHIAFGGVAAGILVHVLPFIGAIVFGIIGSLAILKIKEKAFLHGDTAIGIISHASLGLAIFIVSIARGFNVDLLSYLFGSILSIRTSDMILSICLAVVVIGFILLYYNDLFYLTFDEQSAMTSGIRVGFLNTALIVLTALTIVSSMNVVGLLLASSLIVIPAAAALQLGTSFKKTFLFAALFAVFSVIIGLLIAYYFDFAVSGTVVLLNVLIFLALLLGKRILLAKHVTV
jgi:zinc transport system permease protein